MRHLSLFTGIGGFDLGFDRAGIETVGQVEWDKHCQSVLERHWPDVPRWGDIQEVHGAGLCLEGENRRRASDVERGYAFSPSDRAESAAQPVLRHPDNGRGGAACDRCIPTNIDVLTGGFPCQDISVAGRRAGLDGERSGLWWEFSRLIAECSPRWVVIENVPGLLSSNQGRDMGAILGFLGQHGYGFAWRVLDAQWFGVAQRRRRVFIVGHLGGHGGLEVLAVGEGSAGYPPPSRSQGQAIAVTLEVGARQRYEENHLLTVHAQVRRLTPTECARLQGFPDTWNDHLSDTQRYRQYGNAVAVPVAEWIGRRLLNAG